jgi:hypothetical protein
MQVSYCDVIDMAPKQVICDGTPLSMSARQGTSICGVDIWATHFSHILTNVRCSIENHVAGDGVAFVYSFADAGTPGATAGISNGKPVAVQINTAGPSSFVLGGGIAYDPAVPVAAAGNTILDVENTQADADVAWRQRLDGVVKAGTQTVGLSGPTYTVSHFTAVEIPGP